MNENELIPPKMTRKYTIYIAYKQRKQGMVKAIHQINSDMIGSLVIIKGIVIRTD